ncbi:hypothetical protein [Methylobacterium durans]|uniref:Uncharacterized protein n=1 Tax=Methylobacterium durans TaxID=2202825 RepID=A0A2U8W3U5_9HYPH|nr:hypothetical protein [Methylobacterium durans]AWN40775.1 hypothetical protein DK389_09860 [Methylobacterium durans]
MGSYRSGIGLAVVALWLLTPQPSSAAPGEDCSPSNMKKKERSQKAATDAQSAMSRELEKANRKGSGAGLSPAFCEAVKRRIAALQANVDLLTANPDCVVSGDLATTRKELDLEQSTASLCR